MQKYLWEQCESLNIEVTQSLLMLGKGNENTFPYIIQSDLEFFQSRPAKVYQHLTDFYQLGIVIPMTTKNNGFPVSINDILLTEGDYNGACFSGRAVRLNSGDEDTGWIMHIRDANGNISSCGFKSSAINVIPEDYLGTGENNIVGIEFETCSKGEIPESLFVNHSQQNSSEIEAVYSLHGIKNTGYIKTPHVIRYSDGHSKINVRRN
jgi:hypothetical protein